MHEEPTQDRRQRPQQATSAGDTVPATPSLATRLDELSVPAAERILERAIELESAAPGPGPNPVMSAEMLEQVATELGIDVAHLRQAITEELYRVPADETGLFGRLIAPGSVTVHGPVPGNQAQVRRVVDAWMTHHEGMRKRSEIGEVTTWERDRSFGATVAHALGGSRSKSKVRNARKVTTTVSPAVDEQQLLVVEADTTNLRNIVIALLAASAATGAAVTGIGSLVPPGGAGVAEVAAGVGTFAALGAGVTIGARMWAKSMRDGLERMVDAVRSPHLVEQQPPLPFGLDRVLGMFIRR